jgi:hypothetical protein
MERRPDCEPSRRLGVLGDHSHEPHTGPWFTILCIILVSVDKRQHASRPKYLADSDEGQAYNTRHELLWAGRQRNADKSSRFGVRGARSLLSKCRGYRRKQYALHSHEPSTKGSYASLRCAAMFRTEHSCAHIV